MKDSTKMKESNRRSFLRKIFTLTASAGVAGLLLDRLPGKSLVQPVQAGGPGTTLTVDGNAGNGHGVTSFSSDNVSTGNAAFLTTSTGSGAALQGTCTVGTGVLGTTTTGTGVNGTASAAGGRGLFGFVSDPGAMPLVAQGPSGSMQVNASGAVLATQVGQSSPNAIYVSPQNPPSFSNAMTVSGSTMEADGLAISFTPKLTGNVLVIAGVDVISNNPAFGTFAAVWYGTGTAPSFGARLPSGGVLVPPYRGSGYNPTQVFPVYIPGLTIGTPYWFDFGHAVNAGGTGSHYSIAYTIIEI